MKNDKRTFNPFKGLKRLHSFILDESIEVRERLLYVMMVCLFIGTGVAIIPMLINHVWGVWLNFVQLVLYAIVCRSFFKHKNVDTAALSFVLISVVLAMPSIYFTQGGIYSGMPMWFVAGILIAVLVAKEGRQRTFILILSTFVFSSCLILEYFHPEWVIRLPNEKSIFEDVVVSLMITSFMLLAVFSIHVNTEKRQRILLDQQKKELEEAYRNDKLAAAEQKRQELEAQLKREQQELQTISEAIHGGFKTGRYDEGFTLTYVSEQLAAMLGYTVEEFMEAAGNKMIGIVNVEDAKKTFPQAMEAVARGEMYTMNYRIRCKDGSWKNVEDKGRLIKNPDGEDEFWCFIADQDELMAKTEALEATKRANEALLESQRALEEARNDAEQANRAKTVFLNNMSHDIRTPMNAILGFANLMEKALDKPELLKDYLRKIQGSSEYLLEIINNVLDMAKIDSGSIVLEETVKDLGMDDDSFFAIFEEDIRRKKLVFEKHEDIQHHYVYMDITKSNQIMVNLLSNAIKYTPEGGRINLFVKEVPCCEEGFASYVITVSDTGIGMAKDFQEHVFDSFTRERNTTESKVVGTGLGMSIAKKLVDLMGGTISVESELGKGTTFTVVLTFRLAEKPEDSTTSEPVKVVEPVSFSGKRILLAEDNDLNAEIAIAILSDLGFVIDRTVDGSECVAALKAAEEGCYDLILMDIQMPNLNGYEATAAIRSLDSQKASIPILAMTADAFEEDKKRALNAGMDGHIAKPIDIDAMLKEISKVLA